MFVYANKLLLYFEPIVNKPHPLIFNYFDINM